MKTLIIFTSLIIINFCAHITSQSIVNTFGNSGNFTIKNNTYTYLNLSQVTGYIDLTYSLNMLNTLDSNRGVLKKGFARFLHNIGTNSTYLGILSGNYSSTSTDNTGIGRNSLYVISGSKNTAIGLFSLGASSTAIENSAVGQYCLQFNNIGSYNTGVGSQCLIFNTNGNKNTSVGSGAMYFNVSGSENTSLGYQSLRENDVANGSTAIGNESAFHNSTSNNTSLGYQSLYNLDGGKESVAIGNRSFWSSVTGSGTVAFGFESMFNSVGGSCLAIGYRSLYNSTTNSEVTAVGSRSGENEVSGMNNILLGYNSQASTTTVSNQITLGDNRVSSLRCNVTSISSLSDMRDKKNVSDLSIGLNFLSGLKPRTYNWDKREWYPNNISDGSKTEKQLTAGFIAQELDTLQTEQKVEWLNLVMNDNPVKLEATPGNLLPVIVKAIQELNDEVNAIENSQQLLINESKNISTEIDKSIKQIPENPEK